MKADPYHTRLSAAVAILEDLRGRPDEQIAHAVTIVKLALQNLRTSRGAYYDSFRPLFRRLFKVDRCSPPADWDFLLDAAWRFLQRPRTAKKPRPTGRTTPKGASLRK